ncbi:hypothetical protein AYO47_07690 [Planctomyces sp. SCGC AG-212-M04]|nr:hypothetical protein AYO47_07690 [Planctomyces sp. SCGC AG-212-M04]
MADRMWAQAVFASVVVLAGFTGFAAEPVPRVIKADEARKHVDERVTVTFKVQHAKFATDPDRVYLDSEKDYKDPKNLGLLIEADSLPTFRKARIEKPAEHYDAKMVRATGKVFLRDDLVFIKLEKPEQIEIVKAPRTGTGG